MKEKDILQKVLLSDESEMVAVIGRRRVGKTFLIRTAYHKCIDGKLVKIVKLQAQ